MRRLLSRALGTATAVVCAALVASGCGTGTAADNGAAALDPQALRFKEFSYPPHNTPEALAAQEYIKVTAVGTVEGFQEGVTYYAEPNNSPYPRVYLVVKVDQIFKGAKEERVLDNGRLFVDLDRGPISAADGKTPLVSMADFRRGVPAGTPVALLLSDTRKISDKLVNAELAPRVRTFTPHPQGLIFEERAKAGSRLVPGLIESDELPRQWRTIHSVGQVADRLAAVR